MNFLKKQSDNNLTSEELLEIKNLLQDRINQIKIMKEREVAVLDDEYRKRKLEIFNKYKLGDRINNILARIDTILQEVDTEGERFRLNLEQPKSDDDIMSAIESNINNQPAVNGQRIA